MRNLPDIIEWQRNIALNKDQHSFKLLFLHFYTTLVNFSYSITKSEEAAEEIYADVMLKLWERGAPLNGITNLKSYIYTSVKNASLNHVAQSNRMKTIDIDNISLEFLPVSNTNDHVIANELNRQAMFAIKFLPPKCQLVFKLIRENGLTYKEVSEILNISVNTVEGHMVTALKKLQQSLQVFRRSKEN